MARLCQVHICGVILCFSKDRHYVFDIDHEQAIIALKIDGYGAFGVEQHFIVLVQPYIRRVFDLSGNSYDSARYRGDFYIVRQLDTAFGLFFVLVLANQNTFAYRLDCFQRLYFSLFLFIHFVSIPIEKPVFEYHNYYIR